MPRRRTPHIASVIFCAVVLLAVGAVAWGAGHGKSSIGKIGSAKDQAAARTTLQTGLKLPPDLVEDPTFTACGAVADACLTGSTSIPTTLTSLAASVHSAGGSLPSVCSAPGSGGETSVPKYACIVEGEVHGTAVLFGFGDGWLLPVVPGNPTPRTAVLVTIEKAHPTTPTPPPGVPASAVDAASLLPPTWARAPQPCAGGSTPAPSSAVPSSAAPSSAAPSSAAQSPQPLLTASPPLPACAPTAITLNISVHLALSSAAKQLSDLALSKGFRIDGKPCVGGSTATSCGVWGERIRSGVEELFVAALTDDGRGDTIGTLAVTHES